MSRLPVSFALSALLAALSTNATAAAVHADPVHQELEQEKLATNVYKAYFPSRDIARKAAISFHNELLEADYKAGYLVLQLDAADMDKLRAFGFRLEPATEYIQRRNRALTAFQIARAQRVPGAPEPQAIPGFACYETVEETFAAGDGLIAARPTLASWVNAGSSWLKTQGAGGYDMKVLKLTNSAVAGDKPKLFINSAIHAREYTTAPLVLEFARWLVNGYGVNADATWIMDHHEVHLMLHTNPDGRKRAETGLSWRKNVNNNFCANTNTRGIDLNRNFGFTWNTTGGEGSSGSACNLTYRGPSASSEPETQAVESYIRSLWPDRRGPGVNDPAPSDTSGIHLDIHSFSQLVLWPWGETATPAPNGPALQTMGRRLAWFNGYTPMQSIGLYPTDGTSDAPSYGELGVASFTIELGTAFFESCTSYLNSTRPTNLPALIYAAKVVRTPYLTPAGPDVLEPTLSGDALPGGAPVTLTASATDTRFNQGNGSEPVQAITAAEYTIDTPPWDAAAVPQPLAAADGSFNSSTEALTGTVNTNGLSAGPHIVYVRARDSSGAWGPVSAVFLNLITPLPLPLGEAEPNNALAIAQPVSVFPSQVSGAMNSPVRSERSDTDYFRITLPAGKTLRAELRPNASSDYNLEILDVNGAPIASSALGTGLLDVASTSNTGGAPITVYVRISYASGIKGPNGTYELLLLQ
jgi:carboxypeptidase T